MPVVSVMIPAYNAQSTLQATLESVRKQTWRPLELILVNDGSTDATADQFDAFAAHADANSLSVIVHHQENCGLIAARRKGLELSSGDFLQFLDADDLLHPQKLEVCVNALLTKKADVAVPRTRCFTNETDIGALLVGNAVGEAWSPRVIRRTSITSNLWHSAGPLFARSIVQRAGGFRNDVNPVVEELEFHGRVKLLRPEVAYIDRVMNFYRKGRATAITGDLERLYRGRTDGARIVRQLLLDANVRDFKEWHFLTIMALRTIYQVMLCLPEHRELADAAISELREILRDRGILWRPAVHLSSERILRPLMLSARAVMPWMRPIVRV